MPSLTQTFLTELYEEHLEEASFLYEQRLSLFRNPEISWRRIDEFEQRLEAHLDGLVLGDALALEACRKQAAGGGFGELYAAACIFCRQRRQDLAWDVLESLDPKDAPRVKAVADALKYQCPDIWLPDLLGLLDSSRPQMVLVALEVIGYRRMRTSDAIVRVLEQSSGAVTAKAIWALGRLRERHSEGALLSFLTDRDESLRLAAATALLRLGSEAALDHCLAYAGSEPWAVLPLALAGGRAACQKLLAAADAGKPSNDCLTGLGMLGYRAAVPMLIQTLSTEETAAASASALQQITGCGRDEKVFIPEPPQEDEAFAGEGKTPLRSDGLPYGNTVTRVSQSSSVWLGWSRQLEQTLDPDLRYRNGTPCTPQTLVSLLQHEKTSHEMRYLISDELVIRYGCDIVFDTDMPVWQQTEALRDMARWAKDSSSRFRPGYPYFAGRPIGA
jgi:uncharacterized protein (TIGR02270 family)